MSRFLSDHLYSMAAEAEPASTSFDMPDTYVYEPECFKKFISVLFPMETDRNNRAKILKKLNKYHDLADPGYTNSPEFSLLLEEGIEKVVTNPNNLYRVLKDVKNHLFVNKAQFGSFSDTEDELSSSGKDAREEPVPGCSRESDNRQDLVKERKKKEKVEKLTTFLAKLHEKIKKLEELEVDFDDEEHSNYVKMQRYREKFSLVYEKLCKYTNRPLNGYRVGGIQKINFCDTKNLELNRAVEKWLNSIKRFPDFSEVLGCLTDLNEPLNLNLTKEQVELQAHQMFEKIGNSLQRRRHFDLWDSLSSFLGTDFDPAVRNPRLQAIFKRNYHLGKENEKEVLKYYSERQDEEYLIPDLVPDLEAYISQPESGDEDEVEIANIETLLELRTSSDDDDFSDECDESGNDKSDHDSPRAPAPKTRKRPRRKVGAKRKTRGKKNPPKKTSKKNDNSENINDAGGKGIDSHTSVNSENTETVETNIGTTPVNHINTVGAIPNRQNAEDNLVCNSENLMKRKNENLNENDNDNLNIHPCKKFLGDKEMAGNKFFEETEVMNKSDSDSDCEIIEIVTRKEGVTNEALSLKRNMHQVNYAFINNNVNPNTVPSNNVPQKNHCSPSNYKNMTNQKPLHDSQPNELTGVRRIGVKNALQLENNLRMILNNIFNKPNFIPGQTSQDCDLENDELAASTSTNIINCSLDQEQSGENMESQAEGSQTNQNDNLEQGSSNETAAPGNSGSSSGGSGRDNGENNDKKKPSDGETHGEDDPENEDKEDDDEENEGTLEEEPPETPNVIGTASKQIFTRANQKEQKVSDGAVSPAENVAPVTRSSLAKLLEKPSGSGTTQKKEPTNSTPTATSPRATPTPVRKRKVNQNGGLQDTQEKSNVFVFKFQKGPAQLKKPRVKKAAIPTASSSRDDDIEIIQVIKKKASTPVDLVQSDEDVVRNFLETSHPSISVTTPKMKAVKKEVTPSIQQALDSLNRMRGISASVVKSSSKRNSDDEVIIIGESMNTRVNKISKQKTPAPSATAVMPPPVATATSQEPNIQENAQRSNDIVDNSTVIPNNSVQNHVQNPRAALVNVARNNINHKEHPYSSPAPIPSTSGSASTYQENLGGPQAPAASTSGSASTYQENFSGQGESIPIPRFRNVQSRSRRTPKKTMEIECITLD